MIKDDAEELDSLLADFEKVFGFDGNWRECEAGCGEKLIRSGVCGACEQKRRDAQDAIQRARSVMFSTPETYRWATFDSIDLAGRVRKSAQEIESLRTAAFTPGARFVFTGDAGTGKTSLACALLRSLPTTPRMNLTPLFVHAYELGVARFQNAGTYGEAHTVERAMNAPIVLIDDVGSERDIPTNAIADVIVRRHADGLATIVTTGMTKDMLVARYGAGVVRRIFDGATHVKMASFA